MILRDPENEPGAEFLPRSSRGSCSPTCYGAPETTVTHLPRSALALLLIAAATTACGHTISYELTAHDKPRAATELPLVVGVRSFRITATLPASPRLAQEAITWDTNAAGGYPSDLSAAVTAQVARHLGHLGVFAAVKVIDATGQA